MVRGTLHLQGDEEITFPYTARWVVYLLAGFFLVEE